MKLFSKSIGKAFFLSLLISTIIALVIGGTAYKRITSYDIDPDKININPQQTIIYDKFDNKIAEFEKSNKTLTDYSEIPNEVSEAIISTEDREFFYHSGINVQAIFRSLLKNLKGDEIDQGGSTITQQLVKKVYLNPGKTLERKQKEAILSTIVEDKFSKTEILSFYLSHIFYGQQAYGIESAIKTYFGESIDEFQNDNKTEKVAKAALLAGMPNAPTLYNPYNHPEKTMKRRNTVLTNMYVEGYINKDLYNKAKNKGLLILDDPKRSSDNENIYYPEIAYYTLKEAADELDTDIDSIKDWGAEIHTSFDPDIYKEIRKKMKQDSLYPHNARSTEGIQGAAAYVNPRNGEIYAMTGAKNETEKFAVLNRAFQAKRQPGSAFKPIISYGPALESGKFTQNSMVKCKQNYGDYHVGDHGCYGSKTMKEALRVSNNSTAVWTLNQVGIDNARKYAQKLGIELTENDVYLPIALGGMEKGVTPLEMADAFQVYANDGKRAEAHIIRNIVNNSNNKTIYEAPEPEQTIKESSAKQMESMLRGVVTSGTGTNAQVSGYRVAGKTGTNEMPNSSGNKDIWFIGFNQNIVGSIWMGYDRTNQRNYIPAGNMSSIPARMFSKITGNAMPYTYEEKRNGKVDASIDLDSKLNKTGDKLKLSWENDEDHSYNIYRDGQLIGHQTNSEFIDRNIEQGNDYNYQVVSYNISNGKEVAKSKKEKIKLGQ